MVSAGEKVVEEEEEEDEDAVEDGNDEESMEEGVKIEQRKMRMRRGKEKKGE